MLINRAGLVSLCFAWIFTSSCRPKDSANDTSSHKDEDTFGLLGFSASYISACKYEEVSNSSEYEIISYDKDTFHRLWSKYDGRDCTPGGGRLSYVYNFSRPKKGGNSSLLPGWTTVVFNYESIDVIVSSESLLKSFNERSAYGYNDWQLDVGKRVTGRKFGSQDEALPTNGTGVTSTLKRDGDTLQIAHYLDGSPVAEQPSIYIKQGP